MSGAKGGVYANSVDLFCQASLNQRLRVASSSPNSTTCSHLGLTSRTSKHKDSALIRRLGAIETARQQLDPYGTANARGRSAGSGQACVPGLFLSFRPVDGDSSAAYTVGAVAFACSGVGTRSSAFNEALTQIPSILRLRISDHHDEFGGKRQRGQRRERHSDSLRNGFC
jgi:hypothetical protein